MALVHMITQSFKKQLNCVVKKKSNFFFIIHTYFLGGCQYFQS